MAIYDFSLASMFEITGVDTAMCYRANIFREMGCEVKMIFVDPPTTRDLLLYTGLGICYGQILVVHSFFTDIHNLEPSADAHELADALKEVLECIGEERFNNQIILKKGNDTVAVLHLTNDDCFVQTVDYYHGGCLVRTDYYADVRYASVFYEAAGGGMSERIFYNRDGSVALTQIVRDKWEYNVFPNGAAYNKEQLFGLFVNRLDLKQEDVVLIDRTVRLFSSKSLLMQSGKAKIITILHSEHDYQNGHSFFGLGLSQEYWFWCKYSRYISCMVVSTEEQSKELKRTLAHYQFVIPVIQVIPAACLDRLYLPEEPRKRKSVVCVSRLRREKKIEWTILAAVRAHELDKEITLDIYGTGSDYQYIEYLKKLIMNHHASTYISLKGHVDVTEVYQNYEVFLTTSLGESFGITLLEAVGSGLAMVGLDVRYGNRVFIEDGRNGYLVSYDPEHFYEECPSEIDELAGRIVEILTDEEKLRAFSERSYEIANRYMTEQVKEQWYELLPAQGK